MDADRSGLYGMGGPSGLPASAQSLATHSMPSQQQYQHYSMPPPFHSQQSQAFSQGYTHSSPASSMMLGNPHVGQPRSLSAYTSRSSRSPSLSGPSGQTYTSPARQFRPYKAEMGEPNPTMMAGSSMHAAHASIVGGPRLSDQPQMMQSSAATGGGQQPLRRGQACQACRRRKLKCDAVRPVCGTCEKSRKAAAIANHASPVPEGDCVYDDGPAGQPGTGVQTTSLSPPGAVVSPGNSTAEREEPLMAMPAKRQKTASFDGPDVKAGDNFIPRSRINSFGPERERAKVLKRDESAEQRANRLEVRVRELEERLRTALFENHIDARHRWEDTFTPWRHRSRANSREPETGEPRQAVPILSMLSPLSGRQERHRMQYSQRPSRPTLSQDSGISASEKASRGFAQPPAMRTPLGIPQTFINEPQHQPQPTMAADSNGSHAFMDETLMQLLWPGWSSDLPSAEKVTSLCETFFRLHPLRNLVYKPSFMAGLLLPPRHPHRPDDSLIHAILAAAANISPYHEAEDVIGVRDKFVSLMSDPFSRPNTQQAQSAEVLTFKEFHLSKSRLKVERSLLTDFKNPLDWLSATIICVYVLWYDGRFVESYFLNGFLCRAMAPSGLDKLPSRHFAPGGSVKNAPGIFGTPQGIEEHERRMVLWHAFIADQYTSGPPTFYENLIAEAAIQTNLPCSEADFSAGNDVAPNEQTLSSPDLFTTGHIDDFTLHIKSAVLLRRASTLACRSRWAKTAGLSTIDKHVDEFLLSFPHLSLSQASSDALNASSNISLALIYLHEPYLTSKSLCSIREEGADYVPEPSSANGRVAMAVSRSLDLVHQLLNSSFDFALLHPQIFLSWSVAARMLGKDMVALQQHIAHHSFTRQNGNKKDQGDAQRDWPRLAADEHMALMRVVEGLSVIVEALKRGGVKCVKARRCAELVGAVLSGNLKESYLAHLLYLDGVIPTGDEEGTGHGPAQSTTSTLIALHQPFQHGSTMDAEEILLSLAPGDDHTNDYFDQDQDSTAATLEATTVQGGSRYDSNAHMDFLHQGNPLDHSPATTGAESAGLGAPHVAPSTGIDGLDSFGLFAGSAEHLGD